MVDNGNSIQGRWGAEKSGASSPILSSTKHCVRQIPAVKIVICNRNLSMKSPKTNSNSAATESQLPKKWETRVVVGNANLPLLEVVSGTTQGTVLGFLLFLLFIHDLPAECSPEDKSLVMLLADDTKSFQEINWEVSQQAEDQQSLQLRTDRIAQWPKDWKMEIHPANPSHFWIGLGFIPFNANMQIQIARHQIS